MKISVGKLRGLQQCVSNQGTFTCLALDHRQNLRRALFPENPEASNAEDLRDFKLGVAKVLSPEATAVLFDPEYAAAQAIANQTIPGGKGLVVAIEATGYVGDGGARMSRVLDGWSVEKAKRMGASMIKLLVYYHPDSPTASEIEVFVARIGEECKKHDLGMMLEPLSYALDGGKIQTAQEKRYVVIETARRLTPLGADILKAEFPLTTDITDEAVWIEACDELTKASKVPWILLSAAVDFEVFLRQVTIACNQGASGIAVGRAVWKEAVNLKGFEQYDFLNTISSKRIQKLNSLCSSLGHSINDFYDADVNFDWYKNY